MITSCAISLKEGFPCAEYGTSHKLGKIGDGIRICKFYLGFLLTLALQHHTHYDTLMFLKIHFSFKDV